MTDSDPVELLDHAVRSAVYRALAERGVAPDWADVANDMGLEATVVAASVDRLVAAHVFVLDAAGGLLMAMPFSAVPTAFRVRSGDRAWWANCAWDALGIAAAMGRDVEIATDCPDCGSPMTLAVRAGEVAAGEGVAHFAVPAAKWWEDIGFT